MRIAKGNSGSVANGATFTITMDLTESGHFHGLAVGLADGTSANVFVTSILVGSRQLLPQTGGNIPWSLLITRNGTLWLDLDKSFKVEGNAQAVIEGVNSTGGSTTIYGAAAHGKVAV